MTHNSIETTLHFPNILMYQTYTLETQCLQQKFIVNILLLAATVCSLRANLNISVIYLLIALIDTQFDSEYIGADRSSDK